MIQRVELRVWGIFFLLLGRGFHLLLGGPLLGNGIKAWLGRQISLLCTKQTVWVYSFSPFYITNPFLCLWFVWPASNVTWAGADSLGGHSDFQARVWCCLMVIRIYIDWSFFCLGGWMAWSLWSACDESGLQTRSRVCGAQGNSPCVGNSTQRRDCNEIPGESVSC